jgi:nitroreductase
MSYPNETMRLLYERVSVRNYSKRPVEEPVLEAVVGAATRSASGGNLQPVSVIVVADQGPRERLAEMCGQSFIGRAPVNLVFCIDMRRNARIAEAGLAPYTAQRAFRHFWIAFQDVMIAAQSVCVAADSMGLGTCYIGTIVERIEEASELLALPQGVLPIELLTLGYPASPPRPPAKFEASVMVHRGRYRDADSGELYAAYERRQSYRVIPAEPESLQRFRECCEAVGGDLFAERAVADVEARGGFNSIQHRFGIHYPADEMPAGNALFIEVMRKRGFDIFGTSRESP